MARRARMRFPQLLPDLLQKQLAGSGLAERLREVEIWRLWPEVAGPAVALRAQPLRIINGTLTIAVSSAAWMQELRFLVTMMKDKLNDRLGAELIREIVLRPGMIEKAVPSAVDDEAALPRVLSEQQKAFISEQSAGIKDPEIRAAFADLMRTSLEKGR
jgi:predicted nucleic acid-binding Zn ribbon protein